MFSTYGDDKYKDKDTSSSKKNVRHQLLKYLGPIPVSAKQSNVQIFLNNVWKLHQ